MMRTGRPREFDRAAALSRAMLLFWECGFEATSLTGLRSAMGGISSASFYAAFGSKESLFKEAVALYLEEQGRYLSPLFDVAFEPREALERSLWQSVNMQTDRSHPLGCLVCLAPSSCSPEAGDVPKFVAEIRGRNHAAIRKCVDRGIQAGDLGADVKAAGLASAFNGFLLGVSAQARAGVNRTTLRAAVVQIMQLWPVEPSVASRVVEETSRRRSK